MRHKQSLKKMIETRTANLAQWETNMTPAKLKCKTKNRLLSHAKALMSLRHGYDKITATPLLMAPDGEKIEEKEDAISF